MTTNRRLLVLLALVVVLSSLFGGCTLFKMVFGPNKNAILDWVPDWKEGTVLVYRSTQYDSTGQVYGTAQTYKDELVRIEETSTTTTVTVRETLGTNSSTYYYIANKDKGVFVYSHNNDYLDDNDAIYLKTVVEDGTSWYLTPTSETKLSISSAKTTKDVAAGTYKDAVDIKLFDSQGNLVGEFWFSPTGGLLQLKEIYSDNSYDLLELQSINQP